LPSTTRLRFFVITVTTLSFVAVILLRKSLFGQDVSNTRGADATPPPLTLSSRARPVPAKPSSLPSTARFRLFVITVTTVSFVALVLLREFVFGQGVNDTPIEEVASWVSIAWALPLIPALVGAAGWLLYTHTPTRGEDRIPMTTEVSFRIVSRGQNAAAVREAVMNVRTQMAHFRCFLTASRWSRT
jgi:hypothetical protein